MAFGKRRLAVVQEEPETESAARQIIPEELWKGALGKLLRETGLRPDDAQNLAPTPEAVAARIARDRIVFQSRLRKLNDEIHARTGAFVQPFYLFPEPCWSGDTGHFLTVRMQMSPYEDWNIAFLPPDERFCGMLGLPRHPMGDALLFEGDVDEFLRVKIEQMDAIREECDRTHDFARFKQQQDDLKDVMRAFAGWLREQYARMWEQQAARARAS
jgi:hypothetical protein